MCVPGMRRVTYHTISYQAGARYFDPFYVVNTAKKIYFSGLLVKILKKSEARNQ